MTCFGSRGPGHAANGPMRSRRFTMPRAGLARAAGHLTRSTLSDLAVLVEHTLTLPDGLHAPSHARAWTSARVAYLPREVTDDVLLVVSELVTNAVQHGRPDIVIRLDVDAQRVRIEVRDRNDELPTVSRADPALDRPTGRGLLIVAATASDWGVERVLGAAGKCVWAEVAIGRLP